IVPVQHKADRQRSHSRPFYAQMGISPIAELLISSNIFSSHIESAHKTDPPVYDYDLPVVTVVHTELKLAQKRGEELRYKYSLFLQPFPVPVFHGTATHTVK